ncbi:hypothetical protein [Undibacterium squillarum]|uniref:hypothetical protein n=1 Tax=Undibacterium squillarum TaxID=1131567 RepID=UPI0035B35583
MKIKNNLATVGLAIFLFSYISMNMVAGLDGTEIELYGFPLPWNARSPAFSLAKDIYLLPALLDFGVYFVLAKILLRLTQNVFDLKKNILQIACLIAGISGLIGIISVLAINDLSIHMWPMDWPERIIHVRPGMGF